MKKSNLHCNIAYTSLKAAGKIRINKHIFHEKHEAGVQKELDLCGVVIYDVPGEVSENAP